MCEQNVKQIKEIKMVLVPKYLVLASLVMLFSIEQLEMHIA